MIGIYSAAIAATSIWNHEYDVLALNINNLHRIGMGGMAILAPSVTFLMLVKACDDFPYGPIDNSYYSLYLPEDKSPHGYLVPDIVDRTPWTSNFTIRHEAPRSVTVVDGTLGKDPAAAINEAFSSLVATCIERKLFDTLAGGHSELWAIPGARYSKPVYVERFSTPLFGFTQRGAHMIAYRNTEDGMKVWIARRSPHLYTFPGLLDSTVAGGVKSGVLPFETIVEEGMEEASLPPEIIRKWARSRGVISHMSLTGKGFSGEQGLVVPDYIYCYDIELESHVPKANDDEVDKLYCMSIDELKKALLQQQFKPDSAAVVIDFLIRHSIITPENEEDFVVINMRLHRMLPFRLGAV